jgi:16S rRNA (uracil1498-N3)-methyltransferase
MYNFFAKKENVAPQRYLITGSDYNHIKNVLRMKIGDEILVSFEGKSDLCRLASFENDTATAVILEKDYKSTELPIKIHLFQGLPKSEKMELIIQKAVELGAAKIIPVEMQRSVVKLDSKKKVAKLSRWQSISESAAKQSKRNIVPTISPVLSFSEALKEAEKLDLFLIAYENKDGMVATKTALSKIKDGMSVGILIGPEGGFEENEVIAASEIGEIISLGNRILRTETAAITALSMLMIHAEISFSGDNK